MNLRKLAVLPLIFIFSQMSFAELLPPRIQSALVKRGAWALITGGSRGIGGEFANRFASAGKNIILIAQNQKGLEAKASELKRLAKQRRKQIEVITVAVDLSNPNSVDQIFERVPAAAVSVPRAVAVACPRAPFTSWMKSYRSSPSANG